MGFDNWMVKLDELVTTIIGEWDSVSTLIVALLISYFAYYVFTSRDPDTHPMLLARQAQPAPVRRQGESAVFRSHSAPHGVPLNSGLNVKDPGDTKWSRGRDGDIRDVWRKVLLGPVDQEGRKTGEPGVISTVLGSEQVIKHNLADVTRQINLIGQHIKQNGGGTVAIYLPNSIEFLAALFACAFYDLTAVLLPYDQSTDKLLSLINQSKADTVIAAVGSFPYDVVMQSYPALQQMIWVVDEGSKHMDWNEVPTGTGGIVNVSTWQDIIQDQESNDGIELPAVDKNSIAKEIFAYWPSGELVGFTQSNIIAGVAGQLNSIPTTQRIKPDDLLFPADSLSTVYPLVLTLAALHSNASIALNSIAGRSPDLAIATQGIAPTIVVASATILAKTHSETKETMSSSFYDLIHWLQTREMVQQGVMPVATVFSKMYDSLRPVIGTTPGKLRLTFVSHQTGTGGKPLSAEALADLRIYTGSRIIYALTAPKVAGAVTQTGLYDYRVDKISGTNSHFGAPVTSVELLFKDTKEYKTTDEVSAGEIVAKGPAVVGGVASLGVSGKMKDDHTLALL